MTNATLAHSYLVKAQSRLKALEVFLDEGDYSDVVREAQEIVELSLKAMLRYVGIEPPKYHDVGPLVMEHRERFREIASEDISRLARISRELRKERELAFYGDIDFIPTDQYSAEDAEAAKRDAGFVVAVAKRIVRGTEDR